MTIDRRPAGVRAPFVAALVLALGALAWWWVAAQPRGDVASSPARGGALALELVVDGLENPVHLAAPPGDPRLFVVEQYRGVRVVKDGRLLERPFIDLRRSVSTGSEQGVLAIAFHPDYARNRFVYVSYTDRNDTSRIERWRASDDPDVADPRSATLVLEVAQPYSNHNGGQIAFAPDGTLWIGFGDGGAGGDPHGHGQNRTTLLGKLLRLDVDRGRPYAIPPDNPFAGRRDARPEIWALGLRNPWRFSFDPPSATVFVGDVGQNRWEEVDAAPIARAGLNYGWNRLEGAHGFRGVATPDLTPPVAEYPSSEGCTVIGGHVYRGRRHPALAGRYFYADYCAGWIRSFAWRDGRVTEHREWTHDRRLQPSSFGVDAAGELYVLSLSGEVYRIGLPPPASR
jgi:glucose/arabinose dehydrogenase